MQTEFISAPEKKIIRKNSIDILKPRLYVLFLIKQNSLYINDVLRLIYYDQRQLKLSPKKVLYLGTIGKYKIKAERKVQQVL